MSGLLYREDMDDVRARLTTWWNGGDIGRPAMQITAPHPEPIERIEAMPEPEGWITHYSTSNFEYRVNLSARACVNTRYLGEAVPTVAPDLAPNCLALYLGCRGVEGPGTVWCEPFIDRPEEARFEFDRDNFYWNFCLRLAREQLQLGEGKFLITFPDLIEGLDTLAAMRRNDRLLLDLIERPEWVHASLRQITDRYFHYYDILYDMFRDEVGGAMFWAWAPGRMTKFQPRLTMLQWTPGAGNEATWHRRWWPIYHKTIEAGKKLIIGCDSMEHLKALKKEFGEGFRQFLINMNVESPEQAEEVLKAASD